ncbi:Xan family putative trans-acting RiPP leader peptide [Archangium lansingense]|uniref:Xan family putative trans-acting RiPP leader peptide n=1 Tax=Archangium lansingense TaxID=2995310 RepID=A0ABT4A1K2_9BACT|nr:Xan family putative trans-acting RiPP leader peptide [Archangium lansinium]MCY1075527.1 Xan family putative trans-acting RiPP leader peptide [Archangium lansinium]
MASEEISASPVASVTAEQAPSSEAMSAAAPEKLDELEEINFLLEEIESKIAPLALA